MVHNVDGWVNVIVIAHIAWVCMCVVHCTTRADLHLRGIFRCYTLSHVCVTYIYFTSRIVITHITINNIVGRWLLSTSNMISNNIILQLMSYVYTHSTSSLSSRVISSPLPHSANDSNALDIFPNRMLVTTLDRVIDHLWSVPRYQTWEIRQYNLVHRSQLGENCFFVEKRREPLFITRTCL